MGKVQLRCGLVKGSPGQVTFGMFGITSRLSMLMPWSGEEFWVIQAWTLTATGDLPKHEDSGSLHFDPQWTRDQTRKEYPEKETSLVSSSSKFKADGVSLAPVAKENQEMAGYGQQSPQEDGFWSVEFPHQLVTRAWVEGAVSWSEAAAYACKLSVSSCVAQPP